MDDIVEIDLTPEQILNTPLYNKGSAFTHQERKDLGLYGRLPYLVSSIEAQAQRRYQNFLAQPSQMFKFIFLNALQNRNEVLFYRLVSEHVSEMLPYIYTPTVGDVSVHFSDLHREPRGLYLSYPDRDKMEEMIQQYAHREIAVTVATDGERILGLGDVGVGGMAISIGKLSLYTLFGGIHPSRTLPIFLDVGTNNLELLNDPNYMGWRHERITGSEYDDFMDQFVQTLKKIFPKILLQWEDFAKPHAKPLLDRYRKQILSFNDDIQGTAAVVLAAIFSAVHSKQESLQDQKIALLGGGSAGLGICSKLAEAMVLEGMTEEEAYRRFFVVDRDGLIHSEGVYTQDQEKFAQKMSDLKEWKVADSQHITLLEVVKNAKPTVLIGVSTQGGAFTEEVVKELAKHSKVPVIFPLSNPNSCSEATPTDLIKWTDGRVLFATGSPFPPVEHQGRLYLSAQCNNVYIFPGMGLAVSSCGIQEITEGMFIAAAKELSLHSPVRKDSQGALFPSFENLKEISRKIALVVAKQAIEEGVCQKFSEKELQAMIEKNVWTPHYPIYKKKG